MNGDERALVLTIDLKESQSTLDSLHNHGFDAVPFMGVVGNDMTEIEIKRLLSPEAYYMYSTGLLNDIGNIHNRGSIGCYLSHVNIWKDVVKSGKNTWVFESDVKVKDMSKVKDAINNARENRIKFLSMSLTPFFLSDISWKKGVVPISGKSMRTHAYWITPEAAQVFLSKAFPITCTVDIYMDYICHQNEDFGYRTAPALFGFKDRKSTIGYNYIHYCKALLPSSASFYIIFFILSLSVFITLVILASRRCRRLS